MNKSEKLKKKKYFLFPKFEIKHLLFLFFVWISLLKKTAQIYFENYQCLAKDFLELYMHAVGDFLSIIPYLKMKIREKVKKIKDNNEKIQNDDMSNELTVNKRIKLIHNDQSAYSSNSGIIIKLILYSIIDFISQISLVIYYIVKPNANLEVKLDILSFLLFFSILIIILFSKIILHTDFYRHHWFSFSIDILCLSVLIFIDVIQIIDIIEIENENKDHIIMSIIYIVIKILSVTLYSLANVLAKVMFLYDFISPYALLFFKSIFEFCYLLIFSILFYFINSEGKSIFSKISNIFEKNIYIIIGYTINSFFYNIFYLQIINVFSPNHCVIARVFEYFGIIQF